MKPLNLLATIDECEIPTTKTEFSYFEEITNTVVKKLHIYNVRLNESSIFDKPENIWNETITRCYRDARNIISEMGDFGKKHAQDAVKQTRKLLYMKPQVLHGGMRDIKALGIKVWNEELEKHLKKQLLNEYGLAHDEAMNIARGFMGKQTLHTVTDKHLRDSVLELGKIAKRHIIKTIDNMYRIMLYRYKDADYVVIEAPGRKPEVYK